MTLQRTQGPSYAIAPCDRRKVLIRAGATLAAAIVGAHSQRASAQTCNLGAWRELPGYGRTDSAPTIVGDPRRNVLYALARGLDGRLYYKTGYSAAWEPAGDVVTTTQPAASIDSLGALVVVVREVQGMLRTSRFIPTTRRWEPWSDLPIPLPPGPNVIGAPAIVTPATFGATPTYYATGNDNRVYWNRVDCKAVFPCTWLGWSAIPGDITAASGPAALVANGRTILLVRGSNDRLYMSVDHGAWSQVPALGLFVVDRPAVAYTPRTRQLHAFVRGAENRIWSAFQGESGSWSSWTTVGELTATSGPDATTVGENVYVAAKGECDTVAVSDCQTPG